MPRYRVVYEAELQDSGELVIEAADEDEAREEGEALIKQVDDDVEWDNGFPIVFSVNITGVEKIGE